MIHLRANVLQQVVRAVVASWVACGMSAAARPADPAPAQQAVAVQHPNLFLNRAEIDQMRAKIRQQPWARDLYARLQQQAEETIGGSQEPDLYYDAHAYADPANPWWMRGNTWSQGRRTRDLALMYAIGGQSRYADKVREMLAHYAKTFRDKHVTPDVATGGMGGINFCWAYDLTYDRFSKEERKAFEEFLLGWARPAARRLERANFSNIASWGEAFCGVVGYTVGDQALMDFAVSGPRGLKEAIDQALRDHALWQEASAYHMVYVSSAMTALAEAALHYDGTDLYHWTSPHGNSMKGFFDACLQLAFPCDFRVTTYGAQGTQSALISPAEQNTTHQIGDYFLINDADGRDWNKYDLAYRRYHDPAYAFVLSQNPRRDEWDHALWGFLALTHGDPLPAEIRPPEAKSSIFPESGIAMLRADESPAYWHCNRPAVSVRFGPWAGGHSHSDAFHITLHGKGTLLEPDWFVQWDYGQTHQGHNPTPWSQHPVAHNTLVVDKQCYARQAQSLNVAGHEFGSEAKWICIRGVLYPGVQEQRTLLLTKEYLLDIFDVRGDQAHTYDWLLHALGELDLPGLKAEPFDLGAELGFAVIDTAGPDEPVNRWLRNGARAAAADAWSAVWKQADGRGVQVTMLPDSGAATTVFRGDGPYYVSGSGFNDTFPGRDKLAVPMVVARRQTANTTYVALHEPLDAGSRPMVTIQRAPDRPEVLRLSIQGESFQDSVVCTRHADGQPGPEVVFARQAGKRSGKSH